MANRSGEIIYANQALMDMFRASSTEIVGQSVQDFCYFSEQKEKLENLIFAQKVNNKDSEYELLRPDGTTFHAAISSKSGPMQDSNYVMCYYYDISHRKNPGTTPLDAIAREIVQRTYKQELKAIVRRTSHEFYNPLTIIKHATDEMFEELYSDRADLIKVQQLLKKISAASDRIGSGVAELCKLADDESGEVQ